ncbi:MAG: cobaltochelatase subunit CobN, partial [Paracoccaceae bacterium]|nr:cobaltochelatase subunit CobN [Paracoccaceae bacterium]
PEVDGRIFAGVASFKQPSRKDPDLQYSRFAHRADPDRIAAVVDRVACWHRLAATPARDRKLALILSTYPGKAHQLAHAVGLDALASAEAMLDVIDGAGYSITKQTNLGASLTSEALNWPVSAYLETVLSLPTDLRNRLFAAWGAPENDPTVSDGFFRFSAISCGNAVIALQPERGDVASRGDDYHDLSRTPRHAYVAFYLWLQRMGLHALVHIGAHGTLEWLPGKSVALSADCWPEALTGTLPVIYPFIVNDPGEAAQAKRRIGAVTIGHLPPPLIDSAVPTGLVHLERLLDEYSAADGLDPARRDRLIQSIRDEAQAVGVEGDLGIPTDASPAEAITRIDRFVCDIKESQYGDGLHVFGQGECGVEETAGFLAALNGRRVDGGPSGSPYRGRSDVLPTGRNLFTTDPRAVPSRAAQAQGVKLAEELLRRHLQDHGDWPKSLVVDLWGSATMRTAGEEFAMALHLAGLAPKWDDGSERVAGFEVIPLALLRRPRIDVTLRVSGLFRDVFPGLAQLFEAASAALSVRDEAPEDNPYKRATPRVFGPKPGLYGLAMADAVEDYSEGGLMAAGEAWLSGSEWAIDVTGAAHHARSELEVQVKGADGFVHVQDLVETDLLLASDYAAHEGGFAAAVARLGGEAPALYHLDATRPDTPRARTLPEEISRVVRARAADPAWADGMMRHGFRGAAEIAATLDHMAAFAHLANSVPPHLFDLYHDATLGRADVVDFMSRENPGALEAIRGRFAALSEAGLWVTRRNSIAALLRAGE